MTVNIKNWVENYKYLHNVFHTCPDLSAMPRKREEFESFFYRIDNDVPLNEFKALLKRAREYLGVDPLFLNKVRDMLSKENVIQKREFNKLWNEVLTDFADPRLNQISEEISKPKELIPEKYINDVETFLHSENKFGFIKELLDYKIVNEDKNKVLVFLLLSGAYVNLYQILLEIGESTGGKSHIAENVVESFPKEHTWTLTGASDKALIYKKWDKEKIIHIPEAQRNPEIQENLKDFGDQGIFYYTVEKNKENEFETREIVIGKRSVILTSTIDGLNPQLENRGWKLEPDHSIEQSKAIVNNSIRRREDLIKTLELEKQQSIEEKVLKFSILALEKEFDFDRTEISYLNEISEILNYSFLKIRRDHKKLFDLITIITSWNYKIREYFEIDNLKVLLSHPNDLISSFEIGEEIFMNLTQNLTPEKRKILNCLETIPQKDTKKSKKKSNGPQQTVLKEDRKKEPYFNTNEIYDFFSSQEDYRKSKKTFRNLLNSLGEAGYLEKQKEGRENVYKLREGNTLKLLDKNRRKEIYIKCFELYNHQKEILKSMENVKFFEKKINLIELKDLNLYSNKIYIRILNMFEENKRSRLDIDNIVQFLSLDYSKDLIEKEIYNMIKLGLFTKNFENELIYEKKDGVEGGNETR